MSLEGFGHGRVDTNGIKMRGVTSQHSLFSRHRASSVERELARTPYAFTPKPREPVEPPDILTQRLIGPDIQAEDPETIKRAREQILDPFEDDINVRLAKERLFGSYSRSGSRVGSRAQSPTIFPSNVDFEKRLKKDGDQFENVLFGHNVSFDTISNISEKNSDTNSIRTQHNVGSEIDYNLNKDNKVQNILRREGINQIDKQVHTIKNNEHNNSNNNNDFGSDKSSSTSENSNISLVTLNDLRKTSDASFSKPPLNKHPIVIQRNNFGSDRSVSIETQDGENKNDNKNTLQEDVKKHVKIEEEPAFKLKEFVHLKTDFDENHFLNRQDSLKVSREGVERYKKSRELAKGFTNSFYKNICRDNAGSQDSEDMVVGEDRRRFSEETVAQDNRRRFSEDILNSSHFPPRIAKESSSDVEAFKVLEKAVILPQQTSVDMESVSSTTSSFKIPPTVRSHRVTAFAIVGETPVGPGPPPGHPQSQVPDAATTSEPVASIPPSSAPTGRVSPFRGKGFKPDPNSRHTTPRTSRANSPTRPRANSMSKAEVTAKVQARQSSSFDRAQTPLRDYIKENIEEVKEASEFNRERNEELAEQKRIEEELEIMKELGLIDSNIVNKYAKTNLRSRSNSPMGKLRFEHIPVPNSRIINSRDGFERLGRRPTTIKASPRSVPSTRPHSKTGSPQHSSRIPRRQTSVSPPRKGERDHYELPSKMSNAIAADGRFISNSTSSINDNRVFSVITDEDNNPIDMSHSMNLRSKSSSNLIPGPSILKSKPPKSPGPPPTNRNLSAKRLSPIVATPDKSPTPSKGSVAGRRSTSRSPVAPGKGTTLDKSKTAKDMVAKGTVAKKTDTKSKPGTPNVMSPSRIPKRPSKSLVTSPNASRSTSRAPSRGPARDISPLKKTPSSNKLNSTSKTTKAKSPTSVYHGGDKISIDSESIDSDPKKSHLKRVNSRSSIQSKVAGPSNKPELKRANSKTSLMKPLSRSNSIKSNNEKPTTTTRRKSNMKDVQEGNEESTFKGKSNSRLKPKKSTAKKESVEKPDDVVKQDNETQYDKLSQLELGLMKMDKLIPLTKGNVVSMTTAAITSQPLEIAAKVTSQLPATFEKAREKRILDRNSSNDSIAPKIDEPPKEGEKITETKIAENITLQKAASKTSLLSVKEEKEPLKRSDSIIYNNNNMKLKPIKTPLDPKVQNVKMKIDNILNSSQSSFEDIRERVKKVDKAALDKTNKAIEKATEKANLEIEKTVEKAAHEIEKSTEKANLEIEKTIVKANQEIEKTTEKANKAIEKTVEKAEEEAKKADEAEIKAEEKVANGTKAVDRSLEQMKNDVNKKLSDEVKIIAKEGEVAVTNGSFVLNGHKNGVEKTMPPVETVKKVDTKPADVISNLSNPTELVKVKGDVIKKETLLPVVTVVNERPRGNISESDDKEKMNEAVIRGDPDVESQSGNMSVTSKFLDKKKPVAKIGTLGDSHSATSGTAKGTHTNGAGATNGAGTNGHSTNGHSSNGHSSNGASAHKLPAESNGSVDSDRDVKDSPSEAGAVKKGLCGRIWPSACCRPKPNLSEVQLLNENAIQKRKSDTSHASIGTKHSEAPGGGKKPGFCTRICCCCCKKKNKDDEDGMMGEEKKSTMEEEKTWSDRLICCRGKNKISDSSAAVGGRPSLVGGAPRPSNASRPTKPPSRWCGCCRKKDDWADRRDSILSQPGEQISCWRRIFCCGKKKDPSLEASRRTSMFSKKRSLSQAVPLEDKRSKLDPSLIEHTSMLRGAIPALPVPLAWICAVFNFVVPGLGTICSGLFNLCFGRPRFGVFDGWKPRVGAFMIDLIVGFGQLFTVLFCLVGWGWSIWWATIMIKVARKYRKLRKTLPDPEAATAVTTNNHRAHT